MLKKILSLLIAVTIIHINILPNNVENKDNSILAEYCIVDNEDILATLSEDQNIQEFQDFSELSKKLESMKKQKKRDTIICFALGLGAGATLILLSSGAVYLYANYKDNQLQKYLEKKQQDKEDAELRDKRKKEKFNHNLSQFEKTAKDERVKNEEAKKREEAAARDAQAKLEKNIADWRQDYAKEQEKLKKQQEREKEAKKAAEKKRNQEEQRARDEQLRRELEEQNRKEKEQRDKEAAEEKRKQKLREAEERRKKEEREQQEKEQLAKEAERQRREDPEVKRKRDAAYAQWGDLQQQLTSLKTQQRNTNIELIEVKEKKLIFAKTLHEENLAEINTKIDDYNKKLHISMCNSLGSVRLEPQILKQETERFNKLKIPPVSEHQYRQCMENEGYISDSFATYDTLREVARVCIDKKKHIDSYFRDSNYKCSENYKNMTWTKPQNYSYDKDQEEKKLKQEFCNRLQEGQQFTDRANELRQEECVLKSQMNDLRKQQSLCEKDLFEEDVIDLKKK